jgi:hypothetical protein
MLFLFPILFRDEREAFPLIAIHVGIVQTLNQSVGYIWPFVDMSTATQSHTIAHYITRINHLLLAKNKFHYFDRMLLKTAVNNSNQLVLNPSSLSGLDTVDSNAPTIYLDRLDALKFTEKRLQLQKGNLLFERATINQRKIGFNTACCKNVVKRRLRLYDSEFFV